MLKGETVRTGGKGICSRCGEFFKPKVMRANAWYIGTQCCGIPNSRESEYYATEELAKKDLEDGNVKWREL